VITLDIKTILDAMFNLGRMYEMARTFISTNDNEMQNVDKSVSALKLLAQKELELGGKYHE
jgi:hypothetical protein